MKKNILLSLTFILLVVLSIFIIVNNAKNFTWDLFWNSIVYSRKEFLVLAVACMAGFIVFEGLALRVLTKGLIGDNKVKRIRGTMYSAADIYFSAITPSATGGQPASALFMMWDGIPGGITTIILLINVTMYTLAIMFLGLFAFIVRPSFYFQFSILSRVLIIIGCVILGGFLFLFILLVRKSSVVKKMAEGFIKIGIKLHIVRNPEKINNKIEKVMEDYKKCSKSVSGKLDILVKAFIFNLLQRISQVLVTVFVYLAMNGALSKSFNVFIAQIYTVVGANSIPIPGAIGVSDYVLIDALGGVLEIKNPVEIELVSRGISFYACVLISGVMIAVGYIVYKKKNKGGEE